MELNPGKPPNCLKPQDSKVDASKMRLWMQYPKRPQNRMLCWDLSEKIKPEILRNTPNPKVLKESSSTSWGSKALRCRNFHRRPQTLENPQRCQKIRVQRQRLSEKLTPKSLDMPKKPGFERTIVPQIAPKTMFRVIFPSRSIQSLHKCYQNKVLMQEF